MSRGCEHGFGGFVFVANAINFQGVHEFNDKRKQTPKTVLESL
jgi:hypothetical protein